MRGSFKPDVILGLLVILTGVLALFFWVPADTGSGIVVKSRGKLSIGDAFAPTVGFTLLVFSAVLFLLESRTRPQGAEIERKHVAFALIAFTVFAVSIAAMRWVGPLVVSLVQDDGVSYRDLRDSVPWKYLGFLCGSSLLVGSFICLASRKLRARFFLIGFAAAVAMILIYDLPFKDLLLPPNGDV